MGKIVPFRRRQLPAIWTPYLRHAGWSSAQLRLAVWAGLLLGLLVSEPMSLAAPPGRPIVATPTAEARAPHHEARRLPAIAGARARAPRRRLASSNIQSPGLARAVRMIDGDTFVYQGARIRVADIDTPEVHGRCAYETELAARATRRMRALLAAGPFEMHQLADGRDEDSYGRKLRIVTRGGQSLGDLMVAEGLARTWSGRREPWCG